MCDGISEAGAAERKAGAAERMAGAAERMAGTRTWTNGGGIAVTCGGNISQGVKIVGHVVPNHVNVFIRSTRDRKM